MESSPSYSAASARTAQPRSSRQWSRAYDGARHLALRPRGSPTLAASAAGERSRAATPRPGRRAVPAPRAGPRPGTRRIAAARDELGEREDADPREAVHGGQRLVPCSRRTRSHAVRSCVVTAVRRASAHRPARTSLAARVSPFRSRSPGGQNDVDRGTPSWSFGPRIMSGSPSQPAVRSVHDAVRARRAAGRPLAATASTSRRRRRRGVASRRRGDPAVAGGCVDPLEARIGRPRPSTGTRRRWTAVERSEPCDAETRARPPRPRRCASSGLWTAPGPRR